MSITYRIDPERSMVFTVGSGTLTDDDLMSYATSLRSDPSAAGLDELVDLSDITRVEVTVDGLRRLAEKVAELNPGRRDYKVAVVAPSDVVYGMTRVYEVLRETAPGEARAFRSLEEANSLLASD